MNRAIRALRLPACRAIRPAKDFLLPRDPNHPLPGDHLGGSSSLVVGGDPVSGAKIVGVLVFTPAESDRMPRRPIRREIRGCPGFFSDHQILSILKQAEAGTSVPDLCREHGISSATFYKWRAKFGNMDASLIARLKELEAENQPAEEDVRRRADQGRDSPGGYRGKALRPSRRRGMAREAV